tara:strand:- start:451 stop:615 length:165 start_codon:yes stop_codon:yes gene_type:complete
MRVLNENISYVLQIKNSKQINLNATKISCAYLGDLHTEAKNSLSESVFKVDVPK